MLTVNIHDAKTNLSKLIAMAVKGQPFIIAKAGKPLVKVEALEGEPALIKSRLGGLEHLAPPPEDFDTMFASDIDTMFHGKA
jgi:antitoxin (DNA-binding transcriptional repressor) of toxin-antitoxin stability system